MSWRVFSCLSVLAFWLSCDVQKRSTHTNEVAYQISSHKSAKHGIDLLSHKGLEVNIGIWLYSFWASVSCWRARDLAGGPHS